MTEQQWLASADPADMLRWLQAPMCSADPTQGLTTGAGGISDRKLRLWVCGCCRLVWDRLTDPRSRRAVEVAERRADEGELWRAEFGDVIRDAYLVPRKGWPNPEALAHDCLCDTPITEHVNCASPATQATLLRCVFGNPGRPVIRQYGPSPLLEMAKGTWRQPAAVLPDTCLTPTVLALARAAYEDYDWSILPILADALEEAGCPSPLLAHLRGPGPHCRGCWAVDLILGKE